jgi:hypothetical protein
VLVGIYSHGGAPCQAAKESMPNAECRIEEIFGIPHS